MIPNTFKLALVVAFSLVTCAQAQDAVDVAAAKKEGKVVWYTAFASPRRLGVQVDV